MAKTILILNGHPDPSPERLCHGLVTAYVEGAETVGNIVRRFDVGALEIPFLTSAESFTESDPPPDIQPVISALLAADHVVIVYPLWLGMLPAKLKACLEQVFRPGVALEYTEENKFPKKLLKNKTARVVVTMGMPGFAYKFIMRAHSLKALKNNILKLCGITPVRTAVFGAVEAVSENTRQKWLSQMREWGEKAR